MKKSIFLFPLVLLGGCTHTVVPPPVTPPPSFTWMGTGNPTMTTLTTYTLTDISNPANPIVVATIPIGQLGYVMSNLPSTGTHTYALTVNAIGNAGIVVTSPPATTTVTIP